MVVCLHKSVPCQQDGDIMVVCLHKSVPCQQDGDIMVVWMYIILYVHVHLPFTETS
jgi:hypothetical protein